MSLLKIWNYFRKTDVPESASSAARPAEAAVVTSKAAPTAERGADARAIGDRTDVAVSQPQPAKPKTKAVTKSIRAAQSRHSVLCKKLRKWVKAETPATLRVLEIGVGDGQRAEAVLSTLMQTIPAESITYCGVDTFEMGGSDLTLKDFHRQIRGLGIQPRLFPMPTTLGLTRVAHSLGQCDVILDSQNFHAGEDAKKLTAKLASDASLWLADVGNDWVEVNGGGDASKRAA
ncbi:hypothetical protein [Crateriforma spongiae]|uniref:hypothetical protein n=1 Tax=Crateriforma spongiae TaxID=2724528 RepID=UPI00144595AD|nr:hypothetical protein [Crateriforma spongiae]